MQTADSTTKATLLSFFHPQPVPINYQDGRAIQMSMATTVLLNRLAHGFYSSARRCSRDLTSAYLGVLGDFLGAGFYVS